MLRRNPALVESRPGQIKRTFVVPNQDFVFDKRLSDADVRVMYAIAGWAEHCPGLPLSLQTIGVLSCKTTQLAKASCRKLERLGFVRFTPKV